MLEPIKIGDRFGRLTVIASSGRSARKGRLGPKLWLCRCDCGRDLNVSDGNIRRQMSCGCFAIDALVARSTSHGRTNTAEWRAWKAMLDRCSPTNRCSRNYFERGIRVCDEWASSFEAFFSHVGLRPSTRHELDRIDNDLGYEPGNVRWATAKEQIRNRRVTVRLTAHGETKPLAEWLEDAGMLTRTIEQRIRRRIASGWPHERALADVIHKERRHP
jgi:hypothetical protein